MLLFWWKHFQVLNLVQKNLINIYWVYLSIIGDLIPLWIFNFRVFTKKKKNDNFLGNRFHLKRKQKNCLEIVLNFNQYAFHSFFKFLVWLFCYIFSVIVQGLKKLQKTTRFQNNFRLLLAQTINITQLYFVGKSISNNLNI